MASRGMNKCLAAWLPGCLAATPARAALAGRGTLVCRAVTIVDTIAIVPRE